MIIKTLEKEHILRRFMDLVFHRDMLTRDGVYTISVEKENLSRFYPGMIRFVVLVHHGEQTVARFCTNTYEYSPTVPLRAEHIALEKAYEWEADLSQDTQKFLLSHKIQQRQRSSVPPTDIAIIQGSPRGGGNCSILAGWVKTVAEENNKTARIIYPHDLNIKSCIGCYQCYNTGTCTFDDDMGEVIDTIRKASLLVICSPVYTNSVPGGLKLLIDRCQAYHAELSITGQGEQGKKGLTLSVAGRKGRPHFTCVTKVISAFFKNLGIRPSGEILIDGMDELQDIRNIPGLVERIRAIVQDCFR
jgi:multimeric flavodoxin WrbA